MSTPTSEPRPQSLLAEVAEHTFRRVSAQLHDGVCQSLAGTMLLSRMLLQNLQREGSACVPQAEELTQLLHRVVQETRALVHDLEPEDLEATGLAGALQALAATIAEPVVCEFHCHEPCEFAPAEHNLQLYRLACEALRNAVAHAGASNLRITLQAEGEQCLLEVRDNGCGFDLPAARLRPHVGLRTMEFRAGSAGGTLTIASAPGQGTTVRCLVPLTRPS